MITKEVNKEKNSSEKFKPTSIGVFILLGVLFLYW